MQSVWPHDLTKGEGIDGGSGRSPQPPTNFYGFHIKKHSFQHTCLSRNMPVPAVSAVTVVVPDKSNT